MTQQEDIQAPEDSTGTAEAIPEISPSEGEDLTLDQRLEAALTTIGERDTALAKVTNDLSALKGQDRRTTNMDEALAQLNDRFDGFEAEVRTGLRSAAVSPDTVVEDMEAARQPYDERLQQTIGQRMAVDSMTRIDENLAGDGDTPLLDKNTAPELEEMRIAYNKGLELVREGQNDQAKEYFALTDNHTIRAARAKDRLNYRELLAAKDAKGKSETDQALEDAGFGDHSVGGTSAGGGNADYTTIRDAYIEDPYDPKISEAYMKARAAKGL